MTFFVEWMFFKLSSVFVSATEGVQRTQNRNLLRRAAKPLGHEYEITLCHQRHDFFSFFRGLSLRKSPALSNGAPFAVSATGA